MAQKMELSKQLLESLTKEDFDKIAADAKQLRKLGKIEGIVRRQDPAYRRQHQLFDSALADVISQADAKNVEGATLAFHQLTTSCVVCHKMLRTNPDGALLVPLKPQSNAPSPPSVEALPCTRKSNR